MSEQEIAALARRWFDDLWNKRLDATVHELLEHSKLVFGPPFIAGLAIASLLWWRPD
jgi:hypothetical protein